MCADLADCNTPKSAVRPTVCRCVRGCAATKRGLACARVGDAEAVALDIAVRDASWLRDADGEVAAFLARPGEARC